jgi:hypothetical protein
MLGIRASTYELGRWGEHISVYSTR